MSNNISELTVFELKSLVYDHIANIEASQASMRVLNQEIQKRQVESSKEKQ